ncbi:MULTISPECIES: hypothetical protein [unclassified Microcoleus]|nr:MULTISPECIES: hypothetical protein [unclassified Microcoleus]
MSDKRVQPVRLLAGFHQTKQEGRKTKEERRRKKDEGRGKKESGSLAMIL